MHKIRKLKTLLEKHPDDTKCKERIRKSTETLELLKKFKGVDIMKKVLLIDKPALAVITNGIAIPEEIAVALLSLNKVMQGLIKRFKTELQINEAENDEWKQLLLETSKRRQKIERTEEKRQKRLELKQQKAMGRKRQEWLEENNTNSENTLIDSGRMESTIGDWQIEEFSNDNNKEPVKEIGSKSNKELKRHTITKENSVQNKETKIESRKKPGVFKDVHDQIENVNELNISNEKYDILDSLQKEISSDEEEHNAESVVIDPFQKGPFFKLDFLKKYF